MFVLQAVSGFHLSTLLHAAGGLLLPVLILRAIDRLT
jgi:hypothetical protein